jgi:hypothetical protein
MRTGRVDINVVKIFWTLISSGLAWQNSAKIANKWFASITHRNFANPQEWSLKGPFFLIITEKFLAPARAFFRWDIRSRRHKLYLFLSRVQEAQSGPISRWDREDIIGSYLQMRQRIQAVHIFIKDREDINCTYLQMRQKYKLYTSS